MILTGTRNLKRTILPLLLIVTAILFTGITPAFAVQKTDTASTAGVVFTDIPTAADSMATAASKKTGEVAKSVEKISAAATAQSKADDGQPKTLWAIFLAGFLGGFAAFLMPCIYPMLPLTVSFFTKKAGSRSRAVFQSLLYGLSIIVIYVFVGGLITSFSFCC
jgi:thiol:disulfide interchange protein